MRKTPRRWFFLARRGVFVWLSCQLLCPVLFDGTPAPCESGKSTHFNIPFRMVILMQPDRTITEAGFTCELESA